VVGWTAGAAGHWLDLGYKDRCDAQGRLYGAILFCEERFHNNLL